MKTVIITGSTSDLGKAVMHQLEEMGYQVVSLKVDVTSDASCKQAIRSLANKKIFALINIAGVNKFGAALDSTPQEFMDLLNVNVVGHFRLLKTLSEQKLLPERVINITSLNGYLAWPKFALYCATKFAAEGLGLSLRYELFPKVQITNIAPGAIYRPNAISKHQGIRQRFPFLKYFLNFTTDKSIAIEVEACLSKDFMPARVLVGLDSQLIYWMQKLLPLWIYDRIVLWVK